MERFYSFLRGGISNGLYSFGIRRDGVLEGTPTVATKADTSAMVGFGWRRFLRKSVAAKLVPQNMEM